MANSSHHNHPRGASPAYKDLLRHSRPAEIIAAARAFIHQSPSRPHTPQPQLRHPFPNPHHSHSRSPKARSISSLFPPNSPHISHSRPDDLHMQISNIISHIDNPNSFEENVRKLLSRLAQMDAGQVDEFILKPIAAEVFSLYGADEGRISVIRAFKAAAVGIRVFQAAPHRLEGSEALAAICDVLARVSEVEQNDGLFAKERLIHCFVKVLDEQREGRLGSLENGFLQCLKNVTLNDDNKALCGELHLVQILVERSSLSSTNPAEPKHTSLPLTCAVLRNLATYPNNVQYFTKSVVARLVGWLATAQKQQKLQLNCTRILAKLAMDRCGQDRIIQANGVHALIKILDTASCDAVALLTRVVFILERLTSADREIRLEVGQIATVQRLLELLGDTRMSFSVCVNLSRLVANLTLESRVCQEIPAEVRAVVQLLKRTDAEPKSKELLLNLVAIVTNLSYFWNRTPPENLDMDEWQRSAIPPILPLLFIGDDPLLNEGLYALSNLSTNERLMPQLTQLLIDEAAIILLDYDDLEISRVSCGILTNMAGQRSTRSRMTDGKIVSKLTDKIRRVSLSSAKYITTACQTLFNYLHFHENYSDALIEADTQRLRSTLEELIPVASDEPQEEWKDFVEAASNLLQYL